MVEHPASEALFAAGPVSSCPMADTPTPWDEYKLIQDKIDKIGAFRFQIRGWATTIVSAMIVSGFNDAMPAWIHISGLPILGIFLALEHKQDAIEEVLTKRAKHLERRMYLTAKNENARLDTPRLAHWLPRAVRHKAFEHMDSIVYGLLIFSLLVAFSVRMGTYDPRGPSCCITGGAICDRH